MPKYNEFELDLQNNPIHEEITPYSAMTNPCNPIDDAIALSIVMGCM